MKKVNYYITLFVIFLLSSAAFSADYSSLDIFPPETINGDANCIIDLSISRTHYNKDDSQEEVYPIFSEDNSCQVQFMQSWQDVLMSTAYSQYCSQFRDMLFMYGKEPIIDDVIKLLMLDIANGEQIPGVMEHILENDFVQKIKSRKSGALHTFHYPSKENYNEFNPSMPETISTYSLRKYFRFVSTVGGKTGVLFHEYTHAIVDMIFQNTCKPFDSSDPASVENYRSAMTKFFLNIAKRLNIDTKNLTDIKDIHALLKSESSILHLIAAKSISFNPKYTPQCLLDKVGDGYFGCRDPLYGGDSSDDNYRNSLGRYIDGEYYKLNLNRSEHYVLAACAIILYSYPVENISEEVMTYMIDLLLNNNVSNEVVKEYFSPIIEYWNETIHKYAEKIALVL